MQHDRIAGGLDPQHCFSEQITGDAADHVLGPEAAISTLAAAAFCELASSVIEKCHMLPFCVTNSTGQRIADLAAARQFQQQEPAGALDGDRSATDNSPTFTDGDQGGAIEGVPQACKCPDGKPATQNRTSLPRRQCTAPARICATCWGRPYSRTLNRRSSPRFAPGCPLCRSQTEHGIFGKRFRNKARRADRLWRQIVISCRVSRLRRQPRPILCFQLR